MATCDQGSKNHHSSGFRYHQNWRKPSENGFATIPKFDFLEKPVVRDRFCQKPWKPTIVQTLHVTMGLVL
jgi:hypothetical protein